MNEKDLLQKLTDSAKEITPPPSLSPEAVEQRLREAQRQGLGEADGHPRTPDGEKSSAIRNGEADSSVRRSRFYRYAARTAGIAAVFAVAVLTWKSSDRISGGGQNSSTALQEAQTDAGEQSGSVTAQEDAGEQSVSVTAQETQAAGGAEIASSADPETQAQDAGSEELLTYASDYSDIYEALRDVFWYDSSSENILYDAGMVVEDTAEYEYAAAGARTTSSQTEAAASDGAAGYSTTNVRENGVDEGDAVKTDGRYLYILRDNGTFAIVDAAQADQLTLLYAGKTESESSEITSEAMYLDGDTLQILTTEYVVGLVSSDGSSGSDAAETDTQQTSEGQTGEADTAAETQTAETVAAAEYDSSDIYYREAHYETVLYTYDVSDRSKPVLTGRVTQDGSYSDSRKTGGYIYLFSEWRPSIASTYEESDIIPVLNGEKAQASDYYLPENLNYRNFLVISSVSQENPSALQDSKILVSGAGDFYVSQENIYILTENYEYSNTVTEITKFRFEDGVITGVAAGSVTGYLNDSFSLSEYEGNLRLVATYYGDSLSAAESVTDWTEHNALYILDETLKQRSVIADLAPDETIRSARFLGDIGYFVTFRQTDPLFSVDLSDPDAPQILGELKVSGFSSYLHFYGENLLLGLGYEADETTGSISGLKLSMFDVSDPANVTEAGRYVLSGVTWCESLENYKAILTDGTKNLIGFYCDNRYLVFSWSEDAGFTQEFVYDFYSDGLAGQADSDTTRGLYLGDTFCIAGESFVLSFDLTDGFAKKQTLLLDES